MSLQRTIEELQYRGALIEALLPTSGLDALASPGVESLWRWQSVTVIDEPGFVIAAFPTGLAEPGTRFQNLAVLEGLARGETLFEVPDAHGTQQLYVACKTRAAQTIIIGIPRAKAYEQVDRIILLTLLSAAGVTAALLVIATLGAERLVLAPIRLMLDVTHRVRNGDLTARTGMRSGPEELSQLGASLDAMAEQLAERERKWQQALVEETRLALTDPLTGLYNRRFLRDAVQRQIAASRRSGEPFSLILFDLDRFKAVNDRFGHDAGDIALAEVARVLLRCIRTSDFAVRHGGEEFAVLLSNADLQSAAGRAEEIRSALAAHEIVHGADVIRVTASFGVVQFEPGDDAGALFKAVDQAMYAAKAAGRNRVMVARMPPHALPAGESTHECR